MSDSIPSAHADPEQPLPANAEDRKAAAALSALHTNEIATTTSTDSPSKVPSTADQEALGKAMSRLEIAAGHNAGNKRAATIQHTKDAAGEGIKKKAIKVNADDVNLLEARWANAWSSGRWLQVDQLDLNKLRATELLRTHEGNVAQAIQAFIAPAALAH
ncbi:huntingtin-interacting protein K [Aspergillus saccharolyticus JOP 1030-1]|uniref:Nascent polypeptide-associated complex subunit alpha-like UBA domain-containing protein n=1 Tax=Aspergillus saccharolyticus JOP 1030-1 TaxID=1450539 RepID=A0A318ZIB4_9EURO|nr:hypothetical protein BP01DRAFT_389863 [Aspergillus saccharolyticus JOP 1030-1]PYH47311.1 hypothetical protein BP01DRAFT_389863 [Aspergillus saccharolyticus JOP 1030-1]